ncbi:2-dehydro-3-deoxy-D-gluconate 5-dehydrogenase KduD [Paraburkholderia caribensis]|jgi:2-deoxy-D-gluconate 3-dehydrogenase|uniref:2-dehydro-3-deoxy-D-gluconate 5-dehydrogenase KduD n=1 Tax=Paraburkholderia TaxID=1822464 RepID=UPI001CB1F4C5|nr:2-dehydro-3-deoxy-D-gluconate 5-dehydrogenase KduD [Paraburkholderia caribensis]BEU26690.1 2-dehydro-3-deoxy-D-gluconate 5-dehydrogenase KduD [Paraburkholderia sp. 22B1P]CAG9261431.1 putative 2-keto-3-deoxy-D-gluconate dehydrogenase [Paraburkholderia caribensis]
MTSHPSHPFDLGGKVALVTGSNTGLGAGMARALAAAGCDIVGVSRSDDSDTAQQVKALGRRYVGVSADLSSTAPIDDIVRAALEACGRIDVLVNNAGIIRRADALTFSEDDWDAVMNVNLKSAFFLAQAVARHFVDQEKRGKIINVASMLSFQGGIRVASYTSSKSGMLGLTRLLANEWAARGINVNAIAPGYMATSNTAALRDDEQRNSEILARIPAGRWGTPDDLAGPVVFLASSASDYVHGHTLAVDGGWLAR